MLSRKNINIMGKAIFAFCMMMGCKSYAYAQVDSTGRYKSLTYKEYITRVLNNNLEYKAMKTNADIELANIEAARMFKDPEISFSWTGIHDPAATGNYGLSASMTKTFERPGKRYSRINLAKSESKVVSARIEDFLRNLVADASNDYLDAMKQNFLYRVTMNSYQTMKELSEADSVRLTLGSIKAIDAAQSRIEAGILLNDLLGVDAERKKAFINISNRISTYNADSLYIPASTLDGYQPHFDLNDMINQAVSRRADLAEAKANIDYQESFLKSARNERKADIDVNAGTSNTYLNNGFPSTASYQVFAGIAIPIKFSNFNRGSIKSAEFQVGQVELAYKQTEIKVKNEVMQAYIQYQSLEKQVENFNKGLLDQAKKVLNGKVYSYSRGETSLLEVLNAQRTYNDLQISYFETLYSFQQALVELERTCGFTEFDGRLLSDSH